ALVRSRRHGRAGSQGAGGAAPAKAATVVVLDNDGGGIFSFLPQAALLPGDHFEQLFGAPQLPAVADLVRGCGLSCLEIDQAAELRAAVRKLEALRSAVASFVVVHTDRSANVVLHDELQEAVIEAVGRLG
ncbi:MAG: hypothetical protein ACRDZ5_10815, partial [Acidimicrobiales bacterium]